jgi:hypothetical protein
LCFAYLLAFSLSSYAGSFSGKVSDLDAGNGYLTVTNPAKQKTQTFKVVSETLIFDADGKPSQLLNLVEGTLVSIETAPGDGKRRNARHPAILHHYGGSSREGRTAIFTASFRQRVFRIFA